MRGIYIGRLFITFLFFIGLPACTSFLYHPSDVIFYKEIHQTFNYQDYFYDSLDGIQLHGRHYKSVQKNSKGIIVFFHGNAENLTSHALHLLFLIKHGYDLFIFDYRGYGQSKGMPTPKDVLKDGLATFHFVKKELTQNDKIPMIGYGMSLGGNILLATLSQLSFTLPLVVLDSTFLSFQEATKTILRKSWMVYPLSFFAPLLMNDDYSAWQLMNYFDLKKWNRTKFLVIHGKQDQVIELSLGLELYQKIPFEKKECWILEDGGHTSTFWINSMQLRSEFLFYLNQNLNTK